MSYYDHGTAIVLQLDRWNVSCEHEDDLLYKDCQLQGWFGAGHFTAGIFRGCLALAGGIGGLFGLLELLA